MELKRYLRSLPPEAREDFARRCGTTLASLRVTLYAKQPARRFGAAIAIAIERESGGAVRVEHLRPDVDWATIRGTAKAPV